jgi:dihydrofolate reductase
MRKIIAGFAMSLDGFIDGPGRENGWIVMDKGFDFAAYMKRFDAFFFGRKSWEKLSQQGYATFPGIKSYVFSNTLAPDPKFTLVKGDIKKHVLGIKEEKGKDIAVYGGANLLSGLLDLKLVDELLMSVIPVVIGQGKPMVDVLKDRVYLTLVETKQLASGTVQLRYHVK